MLYWVVRTLNISDPLSFLAELLNSFTHDTAIVRASYFSTLPIRKMPHSMFWVGSVVFLRFLRDLVWLLRKNGIAARFNRG
jgi:hypothetical protein